MHYSSGEHCHTRLRKFKYLSSKISSQLILKLEGQLPPLPPSSAATDKDRRKNIKPPGARDLIKRKKVLRHN